MLSLTGKRKPKLNRSHSSTSQEFSAATWEELYEIYRTAKETEGLAPSTLKSRDKYHRYFMDYLDAFHEGIKPYEITASVIRSWIVFMQKEHVCYEANAKIPDYMKKTGLSPATVNTFLRHEKVFFSFLESEGYIPENPFKRVKMVKEEKDVIQAFTEEQIKKLLSVPDRRSYRGYRDYVMMLLLLDTGIRIIELTNLRIQDVNLPECTLYVRASVSKNNAGRNVPFSKTTRKEIQGLIAEVSDFGSEYLFTTVYGNRLNDGRARLAIKEYGRLAGIENIRVSPHTFRHTFAKIYILNGGDPFTLQKLLGHSDLTMVRRYIQMNDMDLKRQHDRFSPLNVVLKK